MSESATAMLGTVAWVVGAWLGLSGLTAVGWSIIVPRLRRPPPPDRGTPVST